MHISLDTNDLSQLDLQVLALLAGMNPPAPQPVPEAPAPAPATKSKRTPKKAEPEDVGLETVSEPEPEATPEPSESAETAPTMADAVAAATQLVSTGGAATVKAALAAVGAKRVSEVPEDQVAAFLAALK